MDPTRNSTVSTQSNVPQTTEESESVFNATTFYFGATLLLSVGSTVGLLGGFLSDHWEHVSFDADAVSETAARHGVALTRSANVLRLGFGAGSAKPRGFNGSVAYLVNLKGGVSRMCANVDENDLAFLGDEAKSAPVGCISYFRSPDEDYHRKQVIIKYPWLDKMRNLAMSCSIVSLILITSSFPVGGFGIFKRQLSAVMVTGVMFILAALFGIFTVCFMYFKRMVPEGVLTGTGFDDVPSDYLRARRFSRQWSATLSWVGISLCLITSVFWLILARIMRF